MCTIKQNYWDNIEITLLKQRCTNMAYIVIADIVPGQFSQKCANYMWDGYM